MTNVSLLNIKFIGGCYANTLSAIISLAFQKKSSYVCFANAHMVVEANRKQVFLDVLAKADIVVMDGMSVVVADKLLNNGSHNERFAGMDAIGDILFEAEKHTLSVFFYGSTLPVLNKLKEALARKYPQLSVVGVISPPFRELSSTEKQCYVKEINEANPHLVFVSLGCPKQELWMSEMKGQINALMLGVGNAFLTVANLEKRAPHWMQNFGLEWLYRLKNEPQRLWKRYLVTNTLFLWLFLKEVIKKGRN